MTRLKDVLLAMPTASAIGVALVDFSEPELPVAVEMLPVEDWT